MPTDDDIRSIGRFELIYPLGQGGMAKVFVARSSGIAGFEKLVTVKMIHGHLSNQKSFVDMFLDEANLAAQIHHSNVATVHEIGMEDGQLYMVGELIIGQNLQAIIKRLLERNMRLTHAMASHISACICAGLHAAHELRDEEGHSRGLVHRDVSPSNIMIAYEGFVKLIDFGVAKARGRLASTQTGHIKGKISFLSPEQVKGRALDRRSDIFSLGVLLYVLATGHHPFPGESGAARLSKLVSGDFTMPSKIDPQISSQLERIIVTAMASDREDRYSSAAAMGDALNSYIRTQSEPPVGNRQLAVMMNGLFEEEKTEHLAKIRAFGRPSSDDTNSQNLPISGVVGLRPEETGTDYSLKSYQSARSSRRRTRRSKSKFVALVLVILIAMFGFLLAKGKIPPPWEDPLKQRIEDSFAGLWEKGQELLSGVLFDAGVSEAQPVPDAGGVVEHDLPAPLDTSPSKVDSSNLAEERIVEQKVVQAKSDAGPFHSPKPGADDPATARQETNTIHSTEKKRESDTVSDDNPAPEKPSRARRRSWFKKRKKSRKPPPLPLKLKEDDSSVGNNPY